MTKVEALNNWINAEIAMRAAVAAELEARAILCQLAFPEPLMGTNNVPLPHGFILQGVFKQNYNLDSKIVEEKLKSLPRPLHAGLISWSAKLKVGGYNALEQAHKNIINEALTITPARPSLEIIKPKER